MLKLQGNGIDMYDLLNLTDSDKQLLKPSNYIFWVGVMQQRYPSPPIPRTKTKTFCSYPVYLYNNVHVFKCSDGCFYKVPKNEEKFIQDLSKRRR